VYVPVDLCGATKGRLDIQPNGNVTVQAEGGTFSNAQCFTSLDGAWFVPSTTSSFASLTLQNGWTNAPFSTTAAAVENVGGIAHFKGAIASGTTGLATTLPVGYRPSTDVYVPVDLCNAIKGRLYIQPSGNVTVQAENGTFSNAQCFTSLEGASYSIEGFNYDPTCLTTTPEATLDFANGPFATSSPNAAYTAQGCAGEYVVQLDHLDVAWAENYKAGTSLFFKDGAFPSTYQDCVNARLVATVYAYEGGSWIAEGNIAMHGSWVYSGGWSCAPRADSPGSDAVYFNPVFGFSAGRVVAQAYVLPYGQAFLPYALPVGVDLF
jgi:hypothetical protein